MDILQRVTKVARETSEVSHHDHEAVARAVTATLFNWLGDPSDRAIDAGVVHAHHDVTACRRVWATMLGEMRKEAGF